MKEEEFSNELDRLSGSLLNDPGCWLMERLNMMGITKIMVNFFGKTMKS